RVVSAARAAVDTAARRRARWSVPRTRRASCSDPRRFAMTTYFELFQRGELVAPPIARTIGFTLAALERGRATFTLDTDPERHASPLGTVHGGVLCDVADAAMGMAYASTLEEGESFT